ncbi:TPM domain-containing protein [Rhodoferax sp.]|uniref:TPM domain-containing protein n=1 Tax=Rhodoferax sp. TaxID=50421 RepID=UPI002771717A|nr:TPM domain-containing protein [Rhodoferax sp.]
MFETVRRLWRHRWLDEHDTRRAIDPALVERLTRRVRASELRHSGEVRLYIEASLPTSYLLRTGSMHEIVRQRALAMFSKLRVWDTEDNNGVLIYLLLAEHAIELVADRGLNRHVSPEQWHAMVQRMGAAFVAGDFETGLTQALEEVSTLLVQHFAAAPDEPHGNQLPDAPVLR